MQVLVVVDEPRMAEFVGHGLSGAGYKVDLATDGQSVLTAEYDAIVLDSSPPKIDGPHLLGELRRRGCHTPALMLVRDTPDESVEGRDAACDVLVKPFALPELLARLHGLLHRSPGQTSPGPHQVDRADGIAAYTRTDDKLRDLLELVPYAMVIVNEQGQIIRVNWEAEQLFGYGRDEIVGQSIEILVPERFRRQHIQHRARHMVSPNMRPMESRLDLYALRQDGWEFPAEIILSPLVSEEGVLVLVAIRDITRRKQEEEKLRHSRQQLRELSARLVSLREEESARISRTIHDELGQVLTGLKMDVAWLQKHLDRHQQSQLQKTKAMSDLIDTAVQTVRQIATELRPGILDDMGLRAAVEWQLQEFQRRTGIQCTLVGSVEESVLNADGFTTAFRIFQEALTNVARHAQATQVEVALVESAGELTLSVRDNGRGIAADELDNPKSIGLLGMRERALQCGGEVQIRGAPGQGTTVAVRLPLTKCKGGK